MPDFMTNNPFVQGFALGLGAYNQAAGRSVARQQLGMEQQRLSMDQQRMFEAAQFNALRTRQLQQEIDQADFINPLNKKIASDNAEISRLKTEEMLKTFELLKQKQGVAGDILSEGLKINQAFSLGEVPDMTRFATLVSANPDLVEKNQAVHDLVKSSQAWPVTAQNVATQIAHRKYYEAQRVKAESGNKFSVVPPEGLPQVAPIEGTDWENVWDGTKYQLKKKTPEKSTETEKSIRYTIEHSPELTIEQKVTALRNLDANPNATMEELVPKQESKSFWDWLTGSKKKESTLPGGVTVKRLD